MLRQEALEYEQNFSMVMRVLEYAGVKEGDEEYVSPLDLFFQSTERAALYSQKRGKTRVLGQTSPHIDFQ